jgi:UDP-3-O-[3-hydroxymyristoyl] N-acetylglucosamine deacetylase
LSGRACGLLILPTVMKQQTVRRAVSFDGVGLHSGEQVRLTVSPAPADSGIVFKVTGHGRVIPAAPESVVSSRNATTIGADKLRVQTVEHLMAAAAGLGIDNLEVEVSGSETPAGDGSAKPFVGLLASAGRRELSARRRPITIPYPIRVGTDGRWIRVLPSDQLKISYTLDNDHPGVGTQGLTYVLSERTFVEEIAPARTYGFLKDLGFLRKNGLARGVSLDNVVALGKDGPLNPLRFRDEFVRHKILDLIGDLALLGRPVVGHVIARNAGHALNFDLVVAIQRALGLERRPAAAVVRAAPGSVARVRDLEVVQSGLAAI